MTPVWTIAEKTFRRNVADSRFLLVSVLVILLMCASGFLMSREINERLGDDFKRRSSALKNLEQVEAIKTPSVLAFIADGGEQDLPWKVRVKPEYIDTSTFDLPRQSFIESFPLIDWAYVVAVVMSLVALFFSFDLVAGEKEAGRLALQLSNSIRRSDFLLGGYWGTMLSFFPVLLVGIFGSLLIVSMRGSVALDSDHLARIGLVVLLALLYLSTFILLGLLMSSLFHHSVAALISGLMVWMLLVVIIPQASGAVAVAFTRPPTDRQLQREIQSISRQLSHRIGSDMIDDIVNGPGSREEKQQRIDQLAAELGVRSQEQSRQRERRIGQVIDEFSRQRDHQTFVAQRLARLSPTAIFQLVAAELSNTGLSHHWNFLGNARRYRPLFAQYSDRSKWENRDKARPGSQGSASVGGFTIKAVLEWDYSRIPIDQRTFPGFADQWPPLRASLQQALYDVSLMIAINVLLFILVYVRFLRYDVR
jgi:ABC-type transport system involved in multi-copper enzyme maturation permease subunit